MIDQLLDNLWIGGRWAAQFACIGMLALFGVYLFVRVATLAYYKSRNQTRG